MKHSVNANKERIQGEPIATDVRGAIDITGVSKFFGTFQALHELNLTIKAGEYCTLLGPSGCGKTTLLRMIAGHETPTNGDILIDGRSVVSLKSSERGTAMMFQNYALFPHLSVRDNIGFALKMRGKSMDERNSATNRLIEKVGLEGFGSRLPGQLSGGQQQRVALARALITDPTVLLLDEPLSALDEFLRLRMRGELRRIQNDLGITFIHVTHTQLEAIAVSDQIVVMDEGRIEQSDSPDVIYTRPVNTHVARFIGGQNVINGMVDKVKGDEAIISLPDLDEPIRVRTSRAAVPGQTVCAAIRKDRIALTDGRVSGNSETNQVTGEIDAIEYQGSYVTVTLNTPFSHEFVTVISDRDYGNAQYKIGQTVTAAFDVQELHILDETEVAQ